MTITDTDGRNEELEATKGKQMGDITMTTSIFSYYRKIRQAKVSLCCQLKSWFMSCDISYGLVFKTHKTTYEQVVR